MCGKIPKKSNHQLRVRSVEPSLFILPRIYEYNQKIPLKCWLEPPESSLLYDYMTICLKYHQDMAQEALGVPTSIRVSGFHPFLEYLNLKLPKVHKFHKFNNFQLCQVEPGDIKPTSMCQLKEHRGRRCREFHRMEAVVTRGSCWTTRSPNLNDNIFQGIMAVTCS